MDELDREVGEIRVRLDGLTANFEDFRAEARQGRAEVLGMIAQLGDRMGHRLDDHSKRLGALERWRSYIAGALAVLAVMLAVVQFLPILAGWASAVAK